MTKDFTAIVHLAGRLLSSKAQNKFFVLQGVNAKDASLPILLNGAKDEDVIYTGKHVSQTFFTFWTGRRITAREIGFVRCFLAFLENREIEPLFELGKDLTSNFCVFKLRIHRHPAACSPTPPGKMVWTKCPRPVKRVPRRPAPRPWLHPAVPPPRPVAKSPHR